MLLYNEDILDILDQAYDIYFKETPVCNKYLAYQLSPYLVSEAIKKDLKEYNYAN